MILAEMGTGSLQWQILTKPCRYSMQQVKRLIITVPASLYNAVLFAQEPFQLSLGIDSGIRSETVSTSFTCHWGKNDAPSITSPLCCSGRCFVIPLLL